MPTPTPSEYLAIGRLQGAVLSVVQHGKALRPLAETVTMGDVEWRIAVHCALRSIRAAADQRVGLPSLPGVTGAERSAIIAALADVATIAPMADIVAMASNVPSFTLLVKHRLPRALAELDRAIQALTRAVVARQVTGSVGFAC